MGPAQVDRPVRDDSARRQAAHDRLHALRAHAHLAVARQQPANDAHQIGRRVEVSGKEGEVADGQVAAQQGVCCHQQHQPHADVGRAVAQRIDDLGDQPVAHHRQPPLLVDLAEAADNPLLGPRTLMAWVAWNMSAIMPVTRAVAARLASR
jgi:hypothetical protein